MYTENEIEISKSNLSTVISNVKEPVCLLGGWAVYITVNQRFNAEQGRDYIGSRDIDLGFHIDETWSDEQLQKSAFSKSIEILKEMKYYGIGSRFVQHHDLQTKRLLTEEESKKRPKYEMFDLFVDPVVDKIHSRTKALFGLDPIDEPLLANVFSGNQFVISGYFGKEIMLPHPEVLVSMKINSVLNRNKEDKRIKDIADIYSLMWYSDTKFPDLKQRVQKICDAEKISSTVSKFTDQDYNSVSQAIGIGKDEISRVITEMAKK
ncbi:Nucleotidyl transferase of unknown function protein [Marine Group I thaumarchaeote SCGC RSA3]|uniref:Nucleotidyl transferase protein n=2 Tax=Marine Group I TaxID=905826 RepID=A0A081RNV0_9ARCH|nr:Nucleotidyl transferase of unknown function protein [Marine Group I thaumarchaeote SCGC AAA799-N04]KFM16982.1 Nucleotidyl transferase of unknown function protein [Marine Group I thaumarchaeote SCGC RSA3]